MFCERNDKRDDGDRNHEDPIMRLFVIGATGLDRTRDCSASSGKRSPRNCVRSFV
jgi:hypothetical protein